MIDKDGSTLNTGRPRICWWFHKKIARRLLNFRVWTAYRVDHQSCQQLDPVYSSLIKYIWRKLCSGVAIYLVLVSLDVNNKNQGVIVFNFLHSRFSCQWVFDDVMGIHPAAFWNGLPGILGVSGRPEGPWTVKMHRCANLFNPGAMGALDDLLLDALSFMGCPVRNLGPCFLCWGCCRLLLHSLLGHRLFSLGYLGGGCSCSCLCRLGCGRSLSGGLCLCWLG